MEKKFLNATIYLILFDAIATILWNSIFGIGEANPLLAYFLKKSPVSFVTIKLLISFIGVKILNDHIERPMAKIGAYIIFLFYTLVMIMHLIAYIVI